MKSSTFWTRSLAIVFASLPIGACSLLLDTSKEQCSIDEDCAHFGASLKCVNRTCQQGDLTDSQSPDVQADTTPVDPVWGCLGNVVTPMPKKPKVAVSVPLIQLLTKKPVTDVSALVCAKIDVNCSSPLAQTVPDMNGVLKLTLDAGFDGFVIIVPNLPDGGCPTDAGQDAATCLGPLTIPSLVFFNPPLVDDTTYITVLMLSYASLVQLAASNGDTIDPTQGAVFMQAIDCAAHPAKDVAVSLDSTSSQTHGFYFSSGLPSLTASSTDVTGYAGFINVPIGARTVTGILKPTQKFIGKTSVFARAGFISYTTMAPSPP